MDIKHELYVLYNVAQEAAQEAHVAERKFRELATRLRKLHDGIKDVGLRGPDRKR